MQFTSFDNCRPRRSLDRSRGVLDARAQVIFAWAMMMCIMLACSLPINATTGFNNETSQLTFEVHPFNSPDTVTVFSNTALGQTVENPPPALCSTDLQTLQNQDISSMQIPLTTALGELNADTTLTLPKNVLNRIVMSLEQEDAIAYMCASLTQLLAPESPLNDAARQKIFEFQQQLLVLSKSELSQLCGEGYGGCYFDQANYGVVPMSSNISGINILFHEMAHEMFDFDAFTSVRVDETTVNLKNSSLYINDSALSFAPELLAEIATDTMSRWVFGQVSTNSALTYSSAYANLMLDPLFTTDTSEGDAAARYYERYNAGVDRLIFSSSSDLGFGLINAMAEGDLQTVLVLLSQAFAPESEASASEGLRVLIELSDEFQRLAAVLDEAQNKQPELLATPPLP